MDAAIPRTTIVNEVSGFTIADRLAEQAAQNPTGPAVADARRPEQPAWTFRELDERADHLAAGMRAIGMGPDQRVLVFVKPSPDFFALIWGLFRAGVVPILIDPAMGLNPVLNAVQEAEPDHMFGVPAALVVSRLFGRRFRSVQRRVTTGAWAIGSTPLRTLYRLGSSAPSARYGGAADRLAAILFTSGSTGAPKGVLYTHGIFDAQRAALGGALGIEPGEVDLSAFPLFSLFSQALGANAVIPDMDTTRPVRADPERVHRAIRRFGVTYAFGSPAFWGRVVEGSAEPLPLRRLLMAGAPASVDLLTTLLERLGNEADVFTPYGATESLPITMPSARAVLDGPAEKSRTGAGTWVGHPLRGVDVRIIEVDDRPVNDWSNARCLPPGVVGEIVVKSEVTTPGYFRRADDDAASKIRDEGLWHRMGDVGYLDNDGALWFCGRKKHRVQTARRTLFPVQGEAILNRHPEVARTAIVGIGEAGSQAPACFVELRSGRIPKGEQAARLRREILAIAEEHDVTRGLNQVFFHRSFPVDARHNAKIRREVLKADADRRTVGPRSRPEG